MDTSDVIKHEFDLLSWFKARLVTAFDLDDRASPLFDDCANLVDKEYATLSPEDIQCLAWAALYHAVESVAQEMAEIHEDEDVDLPA